MSLLDPLGLYLANEVKWIKLNENWNSLEFPVVIGGEGPPILLLHGFDSSFLEFRRIYGILQRRYKIIIPDLLGFSETNSVLNIVLSNFKGINYGNCTSPFKYSTSKN